MVGISGDASIVRDLTQKSTKAEGFRRNVECLLAQGGDETKEKKWWRCGSRSAKRRDGSFLHQPLFARCGDNITFTIHTDSQHIIQSAN